MFTPILNAIKRHSVIILHRHAHPDCDALGSQIGLKHIILENFPEKAVYMVGDDAGRYAFMDDSVMDELSDENFKDALSIILDTSSPEMIADQRFTLAKETARIDHHVFLSKIADTEAVDSSYESCCGMITKMVIDHNLRLPLVSAKSLFTGMVTDSGRFRYDSTTARTFRLAAFLREQPFDTNEIYNNLYAGDFEQMKLRAAFTQKIQISPKNVAYIYTTREEAAALPMDEFAIARGMVNVMADIKGVNIWVNFTECPEGVICEIRSNKPNINPVAVQFGGGGHAKASGATVKNREEAMAMLHELELLSGE